MPKAATFEVSVPQLQKDCQLALKEVLVDIQKYCQEIVMLLSGQIKQNRTDLKSMQANLKAQQQKLLQVNKAMTVKITKGLQNKEKALTEKVKALSAESAALTKSTALLSAQLAEVKAYKSKEKARQQAVNYFDKNYAVVPAVKPEPVAKPKPVAKKKAEPAEKIVAPVSEKQEPALPELKIGDAAPVFIANVAEDKTVSLSDYLGQKVVLYFYPKDDTPGCTQEARDFMESLAQFKERNTVIFGVSRDSLASHEKFKEKYGLNFTLIADTDEAICKQYDVIKDKNMYGKMVKGIQRSTFLINELGSITQIWRKVKVADHVEDVLAAVGVVSADK